MDLKVLVPDAFSLFSGIETINCALLPRLALRTDGVVWMLPEERREILRARSGDAGGKLSFEDSLPSRGDPGRWGHALRRRVSRVLPGAGGLMQAMEAKALTKRVKKVAGEHGCDSLFYTWILAEDPPGTDLPLYGIFLDRNWARFGSNFPGSDANSMDERVRRWTAACRRVFAISQQSLDELIEIDPRHREKYVHLPLATDLSGVDSMGGRSPDEGEPFCFYYPATVAAHKGHAVLLRAAVKMAGQGIDFQVHLTGFGTADITSGKTSASPAVREVQQIFDANRMLLESRIIGHGYVTSTGLKECYERCHAMVLPSLYEGFGLPLVEGLGRGCRVICSSIPAYEEQTKFYGADEAVQFVRAGDSNMLAARMMEVIKMGPLSGPVIAGLRSRVSTWTWNEVAERVTAVLRDTPVPGRVN